MNRNDLIAALVGRIRGGGDPSLDALNAMRGNVVRDLPNIRQTMVDTGGFTYDPVSGQFIVPRAFDGTSTASGYSVSINPRTGEIDLGTNPENITDADLLAAYDRLVAEGTMEPGINFGGYRGSDERYVIDPSEILTDRRAAMRAARRGNQESVLAMDDPNQATAFLPTDALRKEFRNKDLRTAIKVAALASLLGLIGSEEQ